MKPLSAIKKDLEFNRNLAILIEVLKNIAITQFRILEQKIKVYTQFFQDIESFFDLLDLNRISHPFLLPLEKKQIVVALTSDSGLLGGLNMQVVNTAISELEIIPGRLVVIGERGKLYARERGFSFVAFSGIKEEERLSQALQLRDYLINKFLAERFGYLKIIYPHPVSFTFQKIETVAIFPFRISQKEKVSIDVILESKPADIIEYLLYLWLGQKLYEIFGLSKLSEYAARFTHLEESLQKLKEMDKKIQLEYFKQRHELIDRNMRELFSARLLFVH